MTNTPTPETAITPITEARRMLSEATTVPSLVNLHDFATTAKAWARARGMGVEAENEATEIILRVERKMGSLLLSIPRLSFAERQERHLPTSDRSQQTPLNAVLSEMGLHAKSREAFDFQRLASIEEERFEAMLAAARSGGRVAKVNFYTAIAKADKRRSGTTERSESADPSFDAIIRARNVVLGWDVDEEGGEGPTKNGLMQLADDELRVVATAIKSLAIAYNEAKGLRGG
jgi:hypothetical protein